MFFPSLICLKRFKERMYQQLGLTALNRSLPQVPVYLQSIWVQFLLLTIAFTTQKRDLCCWNLQISQSLNAVDWCLMYLTVVELCLFKLLKEIH